MTTSSNPPEQPASDAAAASRNVERRGRLRLRWWQWLLVILLAAVLILSSTPWLLNWAPARNAALAIVSTRLDGSVRVGGSSFGWFSPIGLYDIEILSSEEERLAYVPALTGTQPLWRLLIDPSNWGRLQFYEPEVHLVIDDRGSNFRRTFGEPSPADDEETAADERPAAQRVPKVNAALSIINGSVTVSRRGRDDWSLDAIALTAGLERSPDANRAPHLVIQPGRPIDRMALSPEVCDDLLKFIAPVLADATWVEGHFSIELIDEARLPLDALEEGHLRGTFAVHAVDVGPGPLVQTLAEFFNFPERVRLADESLVSFELVDGRVHHRNLRFGLPRFWVETYGSVGLDQSLDLVAEIPLAGLTAEDAPIREALGQQTLRVPIVGTLSEPKIDASKLGESGLEMLTGTLRELFGDEDRGEEGLSGEELLELLQQRGFFQDGRVLPEGYRLGDGPLLRRRLPSEVDRSIEPTPTPPAETSRRRFGDRLLRSDAESPEAPSFEEDPAPPGEAAASPAERQGRPLRRLFRRAIEAVDEAAQRADDAEAAPGDAPSPADPPR